MSEEKDLEILVVASKIKKYIKDHSDLKTSDAVMEALTKIVQQECERAIQRAKQDNRKTVLDRDFSNLMKVNV